jgi:biopolymer transport protein TolR
MAMGSGGADRKLMSEINVTPLVDVMLVLLIIFMVTAPLLQEGIAVNLPKTDTSQIVEQNEDNVVLTIIADGEVYFGKDDTPIKLDNLGVRLNELYKDRLNKDVYLKGDTSASYGDVVAVMGEIQKVGGLRLGLITEQGKSKK